MEKETICWGCQNYSKCSWSKGVPVEGWEAEPTTTYNENTDGIRETESFLVLKCPQYIADKIQKTNFREVGKIIKIGYRQMYRLLKKNEQLCFKKINDLLSKHGYKLHIYNDIGKNGREYRQYYLEKLSEGGANESD